MGAIIGKGGSRIQAMREETGVYASILKLENDNGESERIMLLQGLPESIVKATGNICRMLLNAREDREKKNQIPDGTDGGEVSKITVLMDQKQAGAIIGKAGATIKKIQGDTTARMQVSKEPLPGSSERSVTINGSVEVVEAALTEVLAKLQEFPVGGTTVPYVPGAASRPMPHPASQAPQYADPYGMAMMGQSQAYFNQMPGMYGQPGSQDPMQPPMAHMYQQPPPPAAAAPSGMVGMKQQIAIPTQCAGGVIGKGGYRIREIQAQSGTVIQIAPVDDTSPKERIVSISGSQSAINLAISLIQHTVEREYSASTGM